MIFIANQLSPINGCKEKFLEYPNTPVPGKPVDIFFQWVKIDTEQFFKNYQNSFKIET